MGERHIVAMGGGGFSDDDPALDRYFLDLVDRSRPRVCFLPTATANEELHGVDGILREAWEAGVVLYGVSAGALCWFEAGVTDSFGPQLGALMDGLRFLRGSLCPHYAPRSVAGPCTTGS